MNRLNKILLSFVLPFFCLLISVSYCSTIEENVTYPINTSSPYSRTSIYGEIDTTTILQNLIAYFTPETHDEYSEWFNNFISDMYAQYDMDSYITYSIDTAPINYYIYFYRKAEMDFAIDRTSNESYAGASVYSLVNSGDEFIRIQAYSNPTSSYINIYRYTFKNLSVPTLWRTNPVLPDSKVCYVYGSGYLLTDASIKTVIDGTWDGTYYSEAIPNEPTTPSLPSNAEIAQAVQAFYDSDYYKNNTDFKDFLVMYNYNTQYFSFVGHNFGIDLGQVIVPPDYEYEGYSYKQDWWKFFLRNVSSEIASNLWNKYYWMYSTNDFGTTITSNGKGVIKDLVNLHFSTNSIIVYSTTDYPVVKIETDENGILTPVEGTVPGNQYTYDETLNPTENEYNPLENFVPTNPSQTILGNVDFNEINKVFEENKDILNIENASWLFSANNQLVSYFLGFLLLLIVFLIISRVLGG